MPTRVLCSLALSALVTATLGQAAQAETSTANLQVTATMPSGCYIQPATIAFGSVDPDNSSPTDVTGTLDVNCTDGTPWAATANVGEGEGASIFNRSMTRVNGEEQLTYNLYTNAARTDFWSDDPEAGGLVFRGTGTGLVQTVTVYGRVGGNQSSPPGSYSDTIVVTLHY
ncbi:MAG TPA: spore coat U domain-containing protein [Caulobacteraceae bacterium]|nr:spore coat U domain-containing protein [Caulobacteraceae bacterium]